MESLRKYLPGPADFRGVDYWEVRLEAEAATRLRVKNGDVEAITPSDTARGNVRVLLNGGWGFSSFNHPGEVKEHLARAVACARSVGGGDARVLALGPTEDRVPPRCERHPDDVPFREKLDTAKSYEERIRAHAGVVTAEVAYEDVVRYKIFLNSEGRLLETEEVVTRAVARATGKANGVPESHAANFRYRAGFEAFEALGEEIPEMLWGLEELLAARDARGGTYDCIVNPELAGVFVHEAFGHTSEADSFYRDPRMARIMRRGRTLGSPALTIVDDPTLGPKHAGSLAYDDEGVDGRRTVLLEEGVLIAHLHNRATAARLGEEVTGNARALNASFPPLVRMTNTFIEPGEATFEELLSELGDGLYVKDSRGGTGGEEFTFNARVGYLVEGGEITRPVKNFTLAGNLFTTLKNIVLCSRGREIISSAGGCGRGEQVPLPVSCGGPHVLIKNALIGGR